MSENTKKGIGALGISLAVVGGIALAGAGATAAIAATAQGARGESSVLTSDVTGVSQLDLEVGLSDLTVRFGEVDEAELRVEDARGRWELERDGDELVVRGPERRFGWWFGWWGDRDARVSLILPEELRGLDADVDLNAGAVDIVGDFGELDATVGAGELTAEGSASSLSVRVNAGSADVEMGHVQDAELQIAAGELNAELTGTAPDEVRVGVNAGSLDLYLPDELYRVTEDVNAGDLDNRLQTSTQATRTIHVEVNAGSATLRPAD